MNDLPTKNNADSSEQGKNPILATLEAMKRLKSKNTELEIRVENLEKAFEMAFKNGASSLQEFLTKLDENSSKDGNESEEQEQEEAEKEIEEEASAES